MGFLGRVFGSASGLPDWARQIPEPLRPDASQIARIEAVRQEFNLRHEEIQFHMMAHPWMTARVLHHSFRSFKNAYPHLPDQYLYGQVVLQRLLAASRYSLLGLTKSSTAEQARDVAARFASLDAIAAAIASEEATDASVATAPGFDAAVQHIAAVLSRPGAS